MDILTHTIIAVGSLAGFFYAGIFLGKKNATRELADDMVAHTLDMLERDYYYEGDIIVDDCTGNDFYGLVFKASLDTDEYFAATITCVGHYRLIRRIDGVTDPLRIAVSDDVPPGPGTYRLGILVKSDSFTLYVDGVEIYTQISKDLGKVVSGEFGVYAQSVESEELRVSWDNLIATEIER